MSNIFYSEVDRNLKLEMDARGRAGFYDRSEKALNFMLGKIANVECTAYEGKDSTTRIVGTLGGEQMKSGRFLPTGQDGYLTDPSIDQYSIEYYTERDITMDPKNKDIVVGNAYVKPHYFTDSSKRTAPYLTGIEVRVGDHSQNVLNFASFNLTIPNTQRDLDSTEQIWFRPGRYISITIEYPDSVIVSKTLTDGLLTPKSLPIWDRVKRKFPKFKKKTEDTYPKMNKFSFEGLITNFDMSYNQDGSVQATVSATGTSNTYTDISMLMSRDTKPQNPQAQVSPNDIKTSAVPTYFGALHDYVKNISQAFQTANGLQQDQSFIAPFNDAATDQFILYGEPYDNSVTVNPTSRPKTSQTNQTRYVTLGAMIEFINKNVLVKMDGSVANPIIVHNDTDCFSNYYDSIVSCDPENILLLPKNVSQNPFVQAEITPDCNTYGNLIYYPNVYTKTEWPGVYAKGGVTGKIYPSRIFINIETIQKILQENPTVAVKEFLGIVSVLVEKATSSAIKLNLVSHPDDPTLLLWSDIKYIRSNAYDSTASVIPYSIPMYSNHPNGSVVKEFTFSAKIPDSVKSLTYALNSNTSGELSEQELAPHMNFMYNAQNKDQLDALIQRYRDRHDDIVSKLAEAKQQYGNSPGVEEHAQELYKAQAEYIKYPVSDFRKAQQMTAPIWPFEASVTLDGIHGFRYGDVVQFDALPLRYRRNTVFSIFGVTHNVDSNGQWTTSLRCVMRSSID